MAAITLTTQVGQDGMLNLALPQFNNADVEISIRPVADSQHGLEQAVLNLLNSDELSVEDSMALWLFYVTNYRGID
jgi:hypothetical protein